VFGLITSFAWIVYLTTGSLWAAIPAPLLGLAGYAVTLGLIAAGRNHRDCAGAALGYGVVLVAVVAIWGSTGIGLALALSPAVQLTPAVVAAYRSAVPRGIAPGTWALMFLEALMWGGYGLVTTDIALIGYGLITTIGSGLVWGRAIATRPGAPAGPLPAEV
jgi:hypothetical protein